MAQMERVLEDMIFQIGRAKAVIYQLEERVRQLEESDPKA